MTAAPLLLRAPRAAALALALLAPLALAACGGGGWYEPSAGTLVVENDASSFWGIESVDISTPFGPVDRYDVFLAPGEASDIDLVPDSYDVDLLWSDGSTDSFFGVYVEDGGTTFITGWN